MTYPIIASEKDTFWHFDDIYSKCCLLVGGWHVLGFTLISAFAKRVQHCICMWKRFSGKESSSPWLHSNIVLSVCILIHVWVCLLCALLLYFNLYVWCMTGSLTSKNAITSSKVDQMIPTCQHIFTLACSVYLQIIQEPCLELLLWH